MIGLGLSLCTQAILGLSTSMLTLFSGGVVGVWFDPNDRSTLFQDTAGTIPVTAAGQTVGLMLDKSGNGKHASQSIAAQRPTYGVIPYGGVRNFANGSGDVSSNSLSWPTTQVWQGITATKIASGTDTDGLPYVDYSVTGTASSTSGLTFPQSNAWRMPASTGKNYTGSFYYKILSGTPPTGSYGLRLELRSETSAFAFAGDYNGTAFLTSTVETLASATLNAANAATAYFNPVITVQFNAGTVLNFSFRIKGVQTEVGTIRSAFQLNLSKYNVTEAGKASLGVLYPDGIDDGMVTPSINFSGTDKVTIWAGLQKMSNAARGMLVELGPSITAAAFQINAPNNPPTSYLFASYGSLQTSSSTSAYPAPTPHVLTAIGDISGDVATLMVNNVVAATSAADQGTGNYSNNPIYLFRRGGASLPYNGIFTGLIVRGAASSAAQISNGNTYINSTLGAY